MFRSIAGKMLAAFLLVTLLAAFIPAFVMLVFFHASLINMNLAAAGQERAELVSRLEAQFSREGSWQFLREGSQPAPLLLESSGNAGGEGSEDKEGGNEPMPQKERKFLLKRMVRPPADQLEGPWWTTLLPTMAVLDAEKNFVAGNRALLGGAPVPLRPSPEGPVAGYLLFTPTFELESQNEAVAVLLRTFGIIVGGVSLLALLAVWLLARHFRAPISKLKEASRQLAGGALGTRLPEVPRGRKADELQEMACYFNKMAEALENNEKARKQWVADTSHELRTPLTLALGTVAAIRDGLMPASEQSLGRLSAALRDIDNLVEDLHMLARADAGQLQCRCEPVDVGLFLHDVRQAYVKRMEDAGLRLELEEGERMWIMADAPRLRQVMRNVLQNSLQYTRPPGRVLLSLERSGGEVIIACDDTPPAPDAMEPIFQRFYRGESSRSGPGSGLGLAISRDLVLAMGGRMEAVPSALGGLRIILCFAEQEAS